MADQGQPLMTVPQTNLFGAAADDISSILANREVQKRKQMLEDLKTQMDLQKVNNETALAQNTVQTGASTRKINEAAAPLTNARTAAETTSLDLGAKAKQHELDEQAKLSGAMDNWIKTIQDPNADPRSQLVAALPVVQHGGTFAPEILKQLGAQDNEQAIKNAMDKVYDAVKAKNPTEAAYWRDIAVSKGAHIQPADATPFQPFGNGGIMRGDTGDVTLQPKPAGGGEDQHTEKNYQVVKGQIDKLRGEYTSNLPRMERLEATLAQQNPQSDALVAPELLTVMAGGQGSGLRMNEAEISHIVGGRNVWQNLQSKILQYQKDPSQPFLITPEQRRQVSQLIATVKDKARLRLNEIQDADEKLLAAGSVDEQRRIFIDLQKTVEGMTDTAGGGAAGGVQVKRDANGNLVVIR